MKNINCKGNKWHYSLGELVEILASCTANEREVVAALVDLLESGRVQVCSHGKLKRVRVGL